MGTVAGNYLYKIYYRTESGDEELVYVGRTRQKIAERLRGHFAGKAMMRKLDPRLLTKVEVASFPTVADMYLYEIYYINLYKPELNRDDKAKDELTVHLPPALFEEFDLSRLNMKKYRTTADSEDADRKRRYEEFNALHELRAAKRRELKEKLEAGEITEEQREELWYNYLDEEARRREELQFGTR